MKELYERSKTFSLCEKEAGIGPEKLLCWRKRYWREESEVISTGRFPLSRFARRLIILKESSFPKVFSGSGPVSPTPGSRTATTWARSSLQVMPTQDEHIGVAGLQLIFGPWGTAEAKARRACLSESRSPRVRGRSVATTKRAGSS